MIQQKNLIKNLENNGFFNYLDSYLDQMNKNSNSMMTGGLLKRLPNENIMVGGKSICWSGYHRVPGTQPYSKHSCVKN